MAKVISQETFDDAVKENIVEFEMNVEEAREETVQQFEAQGINLTNIIKDLTIDAESGRPILNQTIERLKEMSFETEINSEKLLNLLKTLADECSKSIAHRVMAAKLGAVDVIVEVLNVAIKQKDNQAVTKQALKTWNTLVEKHPDIFDDKSLFLVLQILEQNPDDEMILLILQLLKHATLMHEINRQNIMNAAITKHLKPLLQSKNADVIKDTCATFRHLILDDDFRVEISKAHDHARAIAEDVLADLTTLLPIHIENKSLLHELVLAIAALCVRQEFCLAVEDAGGLKFIIDAMKQHSDSAKLVCTLLKLLLALALNETVRNDILKDGSAELIIQMINMHKSNEVFSRTAMKCLSTLTLRSKANSQLLFDAGAAETISDALKLHSRSKIVQRNCAWAIRNMVSRSRDQCPTFLSYGVEETLKQAMENYPDNAYDFKSALRDLDCEVTLKEEWTGTINKMNIPKE